MKHTKTKSHLSHELRSAAEKWLDNNPGGDTYYDIWLAKHGDKWLHEKRENDRAEYEASRIEAGKSYKRREPMIDGESAYDRKKRLAAKAKRESRAQQATANPQPRQRADLSKMSEEAKVDHHRLKDRERAARYRSKPTVAVAMEAPVKVKKANTKLETVAFGMFA